MVFALLLGLVMAGCDGGSSGTGITTAQGNVASASSASRAVPARRATLLARAWSVWTRSGVANAGGSLENIRVSVEGTTITALTDPSGHFVLRGNFAGPIGLVFELPDGGSGRLVITIPKGGTVTLSNVHVDVPTNAATVEDQHVHFDGLVNATDCEHDAATLVSRHSPTDGNSYTVHFHDGAVHDPSGVVVVCTELAPGDPVDVDGAVTGGGAVEADSIEVEHDAKKTATPIPGGGDRSNPGKDGNQGNTGGDQGGQGGQGNQGDQGGMGGQGDQGNQGDQGRSGNQNGQGSNGLGRGDSNEQ